MDPLTPFALKVAAPAAAAGYRALALEWKRISDDPGASRLLGSLDAALDEAFGVLSQRAETLGGTALVKLKGLVVRPKIFDHPTAAAWVSTQRAQDALRTSIQALLIGDSDAEGAAAALAHYESFLGDEGSETAPAGETVYLVALEFVQKSLDRYLDMNSRLILAAIAGVSGKVDAIAQTRGETSAFVDTHLAADVEKLRKRRFFGGCKVEAEARTLAAAVRDGRFQAAGAQARGLALAQCARWLSLGDPERAAELLEAARALLGAETAETRIAAAFLAAKADKRGALALLDIASSAADATAAFQILRLDETEADGLRLIAEAGIDFDALDPDGRHVLLAVQVQAGQWNEALATVARLGASDFEQAPVLYWGAATMLVAAGAPPDLREVLFHDIPSQPAFFRLREEQDHAAQRRVARSYFLAAAEACRALGLADGAELAERYALWLGLRDPEARAGAITDLRARTDDPRTTLAYLPLALAFGVEVNRAAAFALIDQARARHAGNPHHIAAAILAFLLEAPGEGVKAAAETFLRYRDFLADHIEPASLVSLEVNILADAGRTEEAAAALAAGAPELSSVTRELLEGVVAGFDPASSLDALEAAYKAAPNHLLLGQLVERHRQAGYSRRYVALAREWLGAAPNAADGFVLVRTIAENGHYREASDVAADLGDIVSGSDALLSEAGWAHFHAGRFDAAETALAALESRRENQQDRALRVQLLIASGRWAELDAFVERQWAARETRDALELAQCAVLAAEVGSKRTRALIALAVEHGPDDPQTLSAAYGAATAAGLEEDWDDAAGWIVRAAELSNPDGPVQTASIAEIAAQQPEWNKRVEDGHRMLAASAGPLETIGVVLRKSLTELQLIPMLANRAEPDVLKHVAVPLFSGHRRLVPDGPGARVALDRTAVLTLAALGLLDEMIAHLGTVLVAQDLLHKLFEDRRRIKFHQPSRVAFAHELLAMLQGGKLLAFASARTPDPALVVAVGEALAAMLGEAAAQTVGQHIVVQPSPVMRVGSVLTTPEPVALDAFHDHLCSCSAVVDALVRGGRLTVAEETRARAYLARTDGVWPGEPVIGRGATLYLSDLAVSYFRYVGILEKLAALDVTVVIGQSELDEATALRDWDAFATRTSATIDAIAASIAKAARNGQLAFDAAPPVDDSAHSARTMTSLAEAADLLLCDDRFLTRFGTFTHPSGDTPIASTLDMIDALFAGRPDGAARRIEARTRLRQSGALFVPVETEELLSLLAAASIDDGAVRETAELRAIRENIRLAQMRGWIDLPAERAFIVAYNSQLFDALAGLWQAGGDAEGTGARADWLFALASLRDWADSVVQPGQYMLAIQGLVLDLSKLCFSVSGLSKARRRAFGAWLEVLLEGIWEEEPGVRKSFLDHMRGLLRSVIEDALQNEAALDRQTALALALESVPAFLHVALFEDEAFRREMEQELGYTVTIGGEFSFARGAFLAAVREVYADPAGSVTLADDKRRMWKITTDAAADGWPIRFSAGKRTHLIRGLFALIPDKASRLAGFDEAVKAAHCPPGAIPGWREKIAGGTLDDDAIAALEGALAAWPGAVARAIADSIPKGEASVSLLVPPEPLYYERLAGRGTAATIAEYCRDVAPQHIASLAAGNAIEGVKAALLLGAHPQILHDAGLPSLSPADMRDLGDWVQAEGDILARIGFVEAAMPLASGDSDLEQLLIALVTDLAALDPGDREGRLHFFSSTVQLVDGELGRTGALANWPPFRRRIASFAQAAIIERCCFGRVEGAAFADFAVEHRRGLFFLQTMTDLRLEPRWRPEYVLAEQLRNELIGRIFNRAASLGDDLAPRLREAILGEDASLQRAIRFPMIFWPGPIEGGLSEEIQPPPPEMMELLENAFSSDEVSLKGLNLLANLEAIYRIPGEFLDRSLPKIVGAGTAMLALMPEDDIFGYLMALGSLAGSHRRSELAAHVQRLMRYQSNMKAGVPNGEEIRLAMACAAAHADIAEWRGFLGGWLREIAHRLPDAAAARDFIGWIETLFALDPALRASAGRAYAAARAVAER